MKLILEIPQLSLDKIPVGYQKRLEERTILQIYEDGYLSLEEFTQICQKDFFQVFYQFTISSKRKTITKELYQKRKRYFFEMKSGTEEWDDILENIVSARFDKEDSPLWDLK